MRVGVIAEEIIGALGGEERLARWGYERLDGEFMRCAEMKIEDLRICLGGFGDVKWLVRGFKEDWGRMVLGRLILIEVLGWLNSVEAFFIILVCFEIGIWFQIF